MHAGFKKVARNVVMQRGWYSDADDVDSIQQRMVIRTRCRIVFLGDGGDAVMVTIGNTNQVDIEQLTVDPHVVLPHLSNTHYSSSHFLHPRVPLPVCIRRYHDRGHGKLSEVMNRYHVVNAR